MQATSHSQCSYVLTNKLNPPTSNVSLCFALLFQQLHSEYRSTYRWHEFTGNSRPEVVRRAPAPNPSQFVGVYPYNRISLFAKTLIYWPVIWLCHGDWLIVICNLSPFLSFPGCPAGPTNEPPLPRRKKCPELAYKSHEFIIGSEYTDARRDASAHRSARVSKILLRISVHIALCCIYAYYMCVRT